METQSVLQNHNHGAWAFQMMAKGWVVLGTDVLVVPMTFALTQLAHAVLIQVVLLKLLLTAVLQVVHTKVTIQPVG